MLGWHGKRWGVSQTYGSGGNANVIDITNQCSIEWHQPPVDCYPFLGIEDKENNFQDGETIIGSDSGAQATVFSSCDSRIYLVSGSITGSFSLGETVQGQTSGATATAVCFVDTRSYPDNITDGSYPSSIFSETDFLGFETTLDGAGCAAILKISFPKAGLYKISCKVSAGRKVDNAANVMRYVRVNFSGNIELGGGDIAGLSGNVENSSFAKYSDSPFTYIADKDNEFCLLGFYQTAKGTFNWRLGNIKILFLGG